MAHENYDNFKKICSVVQNNVSHAILVMLFENIAGYLVKKHN